MESKRESKRAQLISSMILGILGLGARISIARPDEFPSVDGVFYLEQARSLVGNQQLPFSTFPPGWPFLISIPLLFADAANSQLLFRVAQGLNVVLGACWPVLTFFLLRKTLDRWWALLGSAILLSMPLALIASKGDLSDLSFGCLLLLVFLLLPQRSFGAGLALGFAYLVRPEALLVAVAVGGWWWWKERRLPWQLVLAVGVFVIPYVVFVHHHTGVWALSGKMIFLESSLQLHEGGDLLNLVGTNLQTFLSLLPKHLGWPVVLLALVGLILRPRFEYLALVGLLPLPIFSFGMADRFWLPYLPFVLLAAGWGMKSLISAVRFVPARALALGLVVILAAGCLKASADYYPWVKTNPNRYHGLRDAGLWLRPQVKEDTRVACYKPFASYWAGSKYVKYPQAETTGEMLDVLEREGVEFLVVNAHVANVFVPNLRTLLSRNIDPKIKSRVEPLKVFKYDAHDQFTVVYRLKPLLSMERGGAE